MTHLFNIKIIRKSKFHALSNIRNVQLFLKSKHSKRLESRFPECENAGL